ncbi:MAG TPA: energy transducer TonB [Pseudolabrys sp.]|nr:energy transducer TonB [Pseudolabrys sp.]
MAQGSDERVTPLWLRPAVAGSVLLLHAGVLIGAPWPDGERPAVMAPLAVQVVPMGQPAAAYEAPQQATMAEVTAVEARASDAQAAQAQTVEPVEAQAVTALELPESKNAEVLLKARETEPRPKPKPKPKPKQHERARRSSAASARSRASAVAQQSQAQSVTGSIASADYRSIVAAELNRRKFYPPEARASGVNGVVVITFTVGADGHVARHAISRSSGQPVLDGAVHRMMAAVVLPPPPGGSFHATVPIRFDLAP